MKASHFSSDIQEFLRLLGKYDVKYVIVGGEAVIFHGYSRLTGDVDFFYERTGENVEALHRALMEFWGGDIPGLQSKKELLEVGLVLQFGIPPNRIDLMGNIDAVEFERAWIHKETEKITIHDNEVLVYFIGLEDLIRNKESIKRHKDEEDLDYLREARKRRIDY